MTAASGMRSDPSNVQARRDCLDTRIQIEPSQSVWHWRAYIQSLLIIFRADAEFRLCATAETWQLLCVFHTIGHGVKRSQAGV